MDAGNFSKINFGQISGPNRFTKAPGPNPNVEANKGFEDKGPRDGVDIGSSPLFSFGPDLLPAESSPEAGLIAGAAPTARTEPTFSFSGPLGLNALSEVESKKFSNIGSGLTALNGINSTTLFTVGGVNVASANMMSPVATLRMPTTSVTTFGIESDSFVTSSGRVVSVNGAKEPGRMPTTSTFTNGLESNEFLTYKGNIIKL